MMIVGHDWCTVDHFWSAYMDNYKAIVHQYLPRLLPLPRGHSRSHCSRWGLGTDGKLLQKTAPNDGQYLLGVLANSWSRSLREGLELMEKMVNTGLKTWSIVACAGYYWLIEWWMMYPIVVYIYLSGQTWPIMTDNAGEWGGRMVD